MYFNGRKDILEGDDFSRVMDIRLIEHNGEQYVAALLQIDPTVKQFTSDDLSPRFIALGDGVSTRLMSIVEIPGVTLEALLASSAPAPEPTPEPAPAPAPEPTPEPSPAPAPEPTPEPAPASAPEPTPAFETASHPDMPDQIEVTDAPVEAPAQGEA